MTFSGAIFKDGRTVAESVPVEVEENFGGWSGVFEANHDWPAEHEAGETPYTLHLLDGRMGEFIPARQVGDDLGGAVVMFRGVGALQKY